MPQESILDALDTDQRVTYLNGVLDYGPVGDVLSSRTDAESIRYFWIKAGREIKAVINRVSEGAPEEFSFEENEVESLFNALDTLASTGRVRNAIQRIFVTLNSWLCRGRLDLCRNALDRADPKILGPDLALSFLTITFAAKQFLNPSRAELLRTCFENHL